MIAPEARGAWRELETRLRPYLARRISTPCDVDDVIQEVFVRVQRGLLDLRDGERFGGWVYRIAERAVADHLRGRLRHPLARGTQGEAAESSETHDDDPKLEAELAECVALFVARLPSPYREAVTLSELEGLPHKEGAEMLGISVSGMKSRVQRGRQQIRRMFEECCEISVDARGHVVDCTPRALDCIPVDCRAAAKSWASRRG